ncbi:MAG: hypothetical protein ACT4OJ_04795 [Bacteroidota bacterium]
MRLFILLMLSIHAGCKSRNKEKYFTGTIEYNYTYTSNSLNIDSISALRHRKAYFRYDENNYVSQFIHPDTTTYYYSGTLNKCISETNSLKNYECEDYSLITDPVLSFRIYDSDEKILGHTCRVLEIQKKKYSAGLLVQYGSKNGAGHLQQAPFL